MKEKLKTQSYSTSKKIPTNRSGSKKRNSLYDNSIKEKGVGWNAPLPKDWASPFLSTSVSWPGFQPPRNLSYYRFHGLAFSHHETLVIIGFMAWLSATTKP